MLKDFPFNNARNPRTNALGYSKEKNFIVISQQEKNTDRSTVTAGEAHF
jgi:hypothetical protein